MLSYIFRRLIQTLVVIVFVIFCAFMLVRLAPGNPAKLMLPDEATDEQIRLMEISLGLDKPLPIQFWNYISGVARGDLGTSMVYKLPISRLIKERFPNTAKLAVGSVLVGCLLAIPLGIISGTRRGSIIDLFCMVFALIGQSMSQMWLGILLIFTFAANLKWLPAMGTGGLQYMILPILTMGYPMAAGLTRIARSGMVDTLGEDFITATYAKGISRFQVYTKYALRNAIIPVCTMIGITLSHQLAGAVVTESVFGWAGMGTLLSQAINARDYPVVQSMLLISALLLTVINFLVDVVNSIIDPRLSIQ